MKIYVLTENFRNEEIYEALDYYEEKFIGVTRNEDEIENIVNERIKAIETEHMPGGPDKLRYSSISKENNEIRIDILNKYMTRYNQHYAIKITEMEV